jgi:hypothetical protein
MKRTLNTILVIPIAGRIEPEQFNDGSPQTICSQSGRPPQLLRGGNAGGSGQQTAHHRPGLGAAHFVDPSGELGVKRLIGRIADGSNADKGNFEAMCERANRDVFHFDGGRAGFLKERRFLGNAADDLLGSEKRGASPRRRNDPAGRAVDHDIADGKRWIQRSREAGHDETIDRLFQLPCRREMNGPDADGAKLDVADFSNRPADSPLFHLQSGENNDLSPGPHDEEL